jgi:hypothetical protein
LEARIDFTAGEPVEGDFALQQDNGDRALARITWERYPWVGTAAFDELGFRFKPLDFSFAPLRLTEFADGAAGFLYPSGNSGFPGGNLGFPEGNLGFPGGNPLGDPRLTKRTLVNFAVVIERPSAEFEGAIEQIELDRGITLSSAEYLRGKTVSSGLLSSDLLSSGLLSVTEYQSGRPVLQRIDLDLDERMETIRWFRRDGPPGGEYPFEYVPVWESSESDWDGDGVYETGEEYLPDRTVVRSWDMNQDGVKEFTVINSSN